MQDEHEPGLASHTRSVRYILAALEGRTRLGESEQSPAVRAAATALHSSSADLPPHCLPSFVCFVRFDFVVARWLTRCLLIVARFARALSIDMAGFLSSVKTKLSLSSSRPTFEVSAPHAHSFVHKGHVGFDEISGEFEVRSAGGLARRSSRGVQICCCFSCTSTLLFRGVLDCCALGRNVP